MIDRTSVGVLIALAAGLALGAGLRAAGHPELGGALPVIEAAGGLWLDLLRMTLVPLVLSLLVTAVGQVTDAAATGRLAVRAVGWFLVLLVGAALYGVVATRSLLALWPVDAESAAALRASAPTTPIAAQAPGLADWLGSIAPANPIAAAAGDAILPLVVFGLIFGFAATRLEDELRRPLLTVFHAVAEAMIVIVRWVLRVGPLGVFALSLGVGARAGVGAAAVLAHYVVAVSVVTAGVVAAAFVVAVVAGRVPLGRFAAAAGPVLVLAASTQSSLACLPPMLERARDELGVSERVAGLVLPLAVAVFRFTSPVANLAVALFVAHVYGLEPGPFQVGGAMAVAIAVSIGSVGLPGQVSFFTAMAPICLALGVPLHLLPILLAIEVIPDIFRTMGNVAGDLAVTCVISSGRPDPG
jgi:proton glutamate symport protein